MNTAADSRFRPLVLGGASFGGLFKPVTDEHVAAALEFAWEHGVRAFDTAPHYGVGLSEERLGKFLATKPRDEFVVSTKVGRLLVDDPDVVDGTDSFFGTPRRSRVRDYSAHGVRRSLEQSLGRLGLDRVDLLLIHDAEDQLRQAIDEASPALSRLRSEGVITGYGVGMNDAAAAQVFVEETDLDHVMIAGRYSLLDREAERGLLPACAERGVAVLVAGVFNSGLLADPHKQATFNYAKAPSELVARALAMEAACQNHGVSLRAAALQFPSRIAAVTAVVSGAGSVASLTDTFAQLEVPVPAELWTELDALAARPLTLN